MATKNAKHLQAIEIVRKYERSKLAAQCALTDSLQAGELDNISAKDWILNHTSLLQSGQDDADRAIEQLMDLLGIDKKYRDTQEVLKQISMIRVFGQKSLADVVSDYLDDLLQFQQRVNDNELCLINAYEAELLRDFKDARLYTDIVIQEDHKAVKRRIYQDINKKINAIKR